MITTERKHIGTLFLSRGILSAGLLIGNTLMGITAVDMQGGNRVWTGIPITVLLAGAALSSYPMGRLMDIRGRRTGLSLGHFTALFGAAITGYAAMQLSLPLFILGIFIIGLGRGGIEQGRYAAAEASAPDRRGRAISMVVLGGTVGALSGPTLTSLAVKFGRTFGIPEKAAPWFIAALLYALGSLTLFLFLRPDPKEIAAKATVIRQKRFGADAPRRPWREIFADPRTRIAMVAMIFSQLEMVIVMTIASVHMYEHDHSITTVSWVILAHSMGMYGLSFIIGWLVDRFGRTPMILIGSGISAVGCAIAPLSTGAFLVGLAIFLIGLGWNFCFVGGSTLLDDVLNHSEKGSIQGSVDGLVRITSGVGSLTSGLVFAALGFAITSWATIAVALIPAFVVLILNIPRAPTPQTEPGV